MALSVAFGKIQPGTTSADATINVT